MTKDKAIEMIMIEFECGKKQANHVLNFCQHDINMYPPLNKLGIELACTSDHDNRDIGYVTKTFLKWDE